MKGKKRIVLLSIFGMTLFWIPLFAQNYQIGVYYFPGWTNTPGQWWSPPWEKIKPFPDREPLLGWYAEKDISVAENQIEWAAITALIFLHTTGSGTARSHFSIMRLIII